MGKLKFIYRKNRSHLDALQRLEEEARLRSLPKEKDREREEQKKRDQEARPVEVASNPTEASVEEQPSQPADEMETEPITSTPVVDQSQTEPIVPSQPDQSETPSTPTESQTAESQPADSQPADSPSQDISVPDESSQVEQEEGEDETTSTPSKRYRNTSEFVIH